MGPKEKKRIYQQYKRLGMSEEEIAEKIKEYEEVEAKSRAEKKQKGDVWKAKYGVRKPPGWEIHYERFGLMYSDRYQTQQEVMKSALRNEKIMGRVIYIQRTDGSERLERSNISLEDYGIEVDSLEEINELFTGKLFKNGQVTDEIITLTFAQVHKLHEAWNITDMDISYFQIEVYDCHEEDKNFKPKWLVKLRSGKMDDDENYYMNSLLDVNDFIGRIAPLVSMIQLDMRKAFDDYDEDYEEKEEENE